MSATRAETHSYCKLWTDNRRLWCHIAYAITRDVDAVDEIVQSAFKKVLACERQWSCAAESMNYFKKAVVHGCVDFLKQRQQRHYRQRPLTQEPLVRDSDPETQVLEREALERQEALVQAILQCWHLLPAAQREALHQVVLHGMSLREFSRRNHVAPTTARSRMMRGLDALRRVLRKQGLLEKPTQKLWS